MKKIQILLLVFSTLFMCNCETNSPIPYDQYLDCTVATNPELISDLLNTSVQIVIKNHSENDLSLRYLYVQLNLVDSVSGIFYGSTILEFSPKNTETYDIKNNGTATISKNIQDIIWNSNIKTSELPAGIYTMAVNVVTGSLDISGNSIHSNAIRIQKK